MTSSGRQPLLLPGVNPVNAEAEIGEDEDEREAEREVTPMQPALERPPSRLATESKKSRATSLSGKPASACSKPFSMSQHGVTQAECVRFLLDRGSA